MKNIIPLLVLSLTWFLDLSAQADVLAAGGDASGSGGSVAYSVGQAAYTHIDGESGKISLGVQQPYFVIMVAADEPAKQIGASLYPNPVSDQVSLILEDLPAEWLGRNALVIRMHDLNGREILSKKISEPITNLSLSDLAEAVYILTVYQGSVEVKSFKIFKSK